MKSLLTAALMSAMLLASTAALADNAHVEKVLSSRPELSTFYKGLVSTGVLAELKPGGIYTIFAPTNEAFAKIPANKYPCFYSAECKAQAADILRNHIVEGELHTGDASTQASGAFSMDHYHLGIAEPYKGKFTVDGKNIVSQKQLLGGVLYDIDGVITTPQEMTAIQSVTVIPVAVVPATTTTTTRREYSNDQPTSVSRTTVTTAPAGAVMIEPAR